MKLKMALRPVPIHLKPFKIKLKYEQTQLKLYLKIYLKYEMHLKPVQSYLKPVKCI